MLVALAECKVAVLWGPPGSGKTTALSRVIQELCSHSARAIRVLVCAPTHNAIVNCLVAVHALVEGAPCAGMRRAIAVEKFGSDRTEPHCYGRGKPTERTFTPPSACRPLEPPKTNQGGGGDIHNDDNVDTGVAVVHGVTPLKLDKIAPGSYDVVVVDEASQMLLPLAALAVRAVRRDTGTLIVAGDHLQLNPVMHAMYPAPLPGHVAAHGSLLDALMRAVEDEQGHEEDHEQEAGNAIDAAFAAAISAAGDHRCAASRADLHRVASCFKLLVNHRMNGPLARLTQATYGADYAVKPALDALRLAFPSCPEAESSGSTFDAVEAALDGEHPLVVVTIAPRGPDAARWAARAPRETTADIEAALVMSLVARYVDHVAAGCGDNDNDNGARISVQRNVVVVAPHHFQRRAVRAALDAAGLPLVRADTVERLQGQTCDMAIVCLAVPGDGSGVRGGYVWGEKIGVFFYIKN
jgi:DNA replication ATP-dependent helicase Dna2